jgi:hypothetical protein
VFWSQSGNVRTPTIGKSIADPSNPQSDMQIGDALPWL